MQYLDVCTCPLFIEVSYPDYEEPGNDATFMEKFREINFRGPKLIRKIRENYAPRKYSAIRYSDELQLSSDNSKISFPSNLHVIDFTIYVTCTYSGSKQSCLVQHLISQCQKFGINYLRTHYYINVYTPCHSQQQRFYAVYWMATTSEFTSIHPPLFQADFNNLCNLPNITQTNNFTAHILNFHRNHTHHNGEVWE